MDTASPGARELTSFGARLKRYRVAAGLSQEALAERAWLSGRAISAYERGLRRAPYRDTLLQLDRALGLSSLAPHRRRPNKSRSSAGSVRRGIRWVKNWPRRRGPWARR